MQCAKEWPIDQNNGYVVFCASDDETIMTMCRRAVLKIAFLNSGDIPKFQPVEMNERRTLKFKLENSVALATLF